MLYASAGDGASFNYADERPVAGRTGNPCGDPAREGGSIRAQDLRTGGDPRGARRLASCGSTRTRARRRPATRSARADANTKRIVGQGLRNPFRLAVRPGTDELWAADVGWNVWEEIDRSTPPAAGTYRNFGWPCYEGGERLGAWDQLDNPVCEGLYGANTVTPPYYAYRHADKVVAAEACPSGTSSISALAFYDGGTFPAEYDGALFFADYARKCAWAMLRGTNGLPDPARIRTFVTGTAVVDLQVGPGGALFVVDIGTGDGAAHPGAGRQPRPHGARDRDARAAAPRRSRSRSTPAAPPIPTAAARLRVGPRRQRQLRGQHRRVVDPRVLRPHAGRPARARRERPRGLRAGPRRARRPAAGDHREPRAGHHVEGRRPAGLQRERDHAAPARRCPRAR